MNTRKAISSAALTLALTTSNAYAGPISLADFDNSAYQLEDFSSLTRAPTRGPFSLGDLSFSEIPGGSGVAGWA